MDEPLKVLKMKLLEEEKQRLLRTTPGGCRKTTLEKMLGYDQEIRGSFREDQRIHVLALIDVWQELYKHDEDGIDAIAILHELTSRNLANLVMTRKNASEINDYYNEDYVTQHDLLRELAMFESCQGPERQRQRQIIDASENTQDQQPINARLLSISTDESFSSTWCDIHAPNVEVLVLNFQKKHTSYLILCIKWINSRFW
nr:putative disease resistance protein [Quercus suber]